MRCEISQQIARFLTTGIPMGDIFVNCGADEWGNVDCACTRSQCNDLLDSWGITNPAERSAAMGQLIPAAEWLDKNPDH